MMLSFWHCTFAMPKHTDVISWLVGNNSKMVTYAFLLGFSRPSRQKEWCVVKYTGSIGSRFLKTKHLIELSAWSPFQLNSDLEQFCLKLLGLLSQEIIPKSQWSNSLICFIKLCRDFFSLKLHITKLLDGQPIQLLMLFEILYKFA